MNKQILYIFLLYCFFSSSYCFPQNADESSKLKEVPKLFKSQELLQIKMTYSNKDIKLNTNDSTYIKTVLAYNNNDSWDSLDIEIRSRGNFRFENCNYTPLKLKIKKSKAKGTLFKGNKKLKMVLPCLKYKSKNDKVINEFMAYKLYELVSPYHFNTRLVKFKFTDNRGKKRKIHELMAFLIEDDKTVAKRHKGKVLDQSIHPLNHEDLSSARNAIFQFMIANTDYSTMYQHNEKLLFINNTIIPVPYDFDMSGLVNASYSVVSEINGADIGISKVTQRLFRGFKRDQKIFYKVRAEFLENKNEFLSIVNGLSPYYDDAKEHQKSLEFIQEFFEIISNDKKFNNMIINKARAGK